MRARGCLIAGAVVVALLGAVAALLGPGLVRRARSVYAPISRMKDEQREFEAWTRQHAWKEPATPALGAGRLEAFLALRKDLRELDEKGAGLRRRAPAQGERARLEDVPAIVEGVGGLVRDRLAAFRRRDMTPAEYEYIEHVVYGIWLPGLAASGDDPAARERAAREVEQAAAKESAAVKARLHQVATGLRNRVPPAPKGIPPEVHHLLLDHATDIAAQPMDRVRAGVSRARGRSRPEPASSP
jgi:hypothetical protein